MDTRKAVLGFIGVGAMGMPLATRLVKAGFKLVVFDHERDKIMAMRERGAAPAPSVRVLAMEADVIISCVPDDDAVRAVYDSGSEGVLAAATPGNIVIEMSTVSPESSRALARAGKERGVEVLDVAITGGPLAAAEGAVTLLAGGSEETFKQCLPILDVLAHQHFYLGPSGAGTAMKLVVNTVLGVSMQAIAEAITLGQRLGLGREILLDVLAKTPVVALAQQPRLAHVASDDYSSQFSAALMNKDFRLILERAAAMRVPMPATAAAFQISLLALANHPNHDYSTVIATMEELIRAGTPAPPPTAPRADKS